MKLLVIIKYFAFVSLVVCLTNCTQQKTINSNQNFVFDGNEPFWELIINKSFIEINMYSLNTKLKEKVILSQVSERGETIGFKSKNVYGVINKTWNVPCELSVSEKDSLNFEIFFVYNKKTYKGCGEKK